MIDIYCIHSIITQATWLNGRASLWTNREAHTKKNNNRTECYGNIYTQRSAGNIQQQRFCAWKPILRTLHWPCTVVDVVYILSFVHILLGSAFDFNIASRTDPCSIHIWTKLLRLDVHFVQLSNNPKSHDQASDKCKCIHVTYRIDIRRRWDVRVCYENISYIVYTK